MTMMNKKLLISLVCVLGVSLALNFAFAGYMLGRCHAFPKEKPMMMPMRGGKMKPPFAEFGKIFKANKKEMKKAHRAVVAEIRRNPIDEAKLSEAMGKAAEVRRRIDEQVEAAMKERILKMTPEERAEFARRFEKGFKDCGKGRKMPFMKAHFHGKHGHRFPPRGNDMRPPMPPRDDNLPPPTPEPETDND